MTRAPFRIAAKQAPAAKAKQALMIAANELGVFTFYFPIQLADPAQRHSIRRMLADQFGIALALPDVHHVAISGRPDGGTFTLTYGSTQTTGPIPHDATPEQVAAALRALDGIDDDVTVTSIGTQYVVTFDLAEHDRPKLTAAADFTGGTNPGISVQRPAAVFHLVVLDGQPILLPEDDALAFTFGVVLARRGLDAARRVSYRPEMLPAPKE